MRNELVESKTVLLGRIEEYVMFGALKEKKVASGWRMECSKARS